MGSKRRRRTISKLSSELAGRQADSTLPTTVRSRANASRPPGPPTSMVGAVSAAMRSDSGMEITTSVPGTAAAAPVRACANEN